MDKRKVIESSSVQIRMFGIFWHKSQFFCLVVQRLLHFKEAMNESAAKSVI